MPPRATPDRARTACIMPPAGFARTGGFTLMEIMVVVIIIGVMIAVTTLSVGLLGKDRQTEDQLRRVWAVLRQAQEEGELQSIDIGMYITSTGYEFLRLDARKNLWVPIEYDKLYATRELPEGLRFRIWLDAREIVLKPEPADREDNDASKKWPPQLMVLSSGDIMPFEMHVERDGAQALWRVVGMPDNDLRLEKRVGAEPWSIVAQTRPPPADDGKDDDKRVARAPSR